VAASTLLRKLLLAIPEAIIHHRAFTAFTESLQAENAKELIKWEEQVRSWEADHTLPCPYEIPEESKSTTLAWYVLRLIANSLINIEITFAEVKRQLSQEEHERVVREGTTVDLDDASISTFIVAALELEEAQ
jgi:hypothetical protein